MRTILIVFRLVAAILLAAVFGLAQNQQQPTGIEQPLVRVNVDLVQIDVVVTDSKGHHVADLRPDEFEVLDNGKPQPITNFSYLAGTAVAPAAAPSPAAQSSQARSAAPVPPARIAPGQANRTIAIVVDDLGLSEESFLSLRPALERFVEQQIQPGDLVALITTSGRLGALQQLTSDKRLLLAAVAKLRSLPNHRPGLMESGFTCVWFNHRFEGKPVAEVQDEDVWLGGQGFCPTCPPELDPQLELMNDHRSEYYSRLSISALHRVVDALRELPGRKSILLFSEGVPLVRGQGLGESNSMLIDAYNAFLNHANRSAVAVNTIDPRGLVSLSATAEFGHAAEDPCDRARQTELVNTQQLLAEIARKTGGIAIKDDNDLSVAMARVMDDQVGYYLIGFKPAAAASVKAARATPAFRRISIRVKRPGLIVRFHSSVYEEQALPPAPGGALALSHAVGSPFALPGLRLRLSSRFWDSGAAAGNILDNVLMIDARDLTFTTEPDSRRKLSFDVLAVIYGPDTQPVDFLNKSYAFTLAPAAYERALAEGVLQRLQLSVKLPGAYQVRVAVRDPATGRIGSASAFVEVPAPARGRIALSGIALSAEPGAPSVIRYRPGQTIYYAYQVLNASPARDGSFNVEVQAALFRDGRNLGSSKLAPADMKDQPDPKRLVVTGDLRLGPALPPGDYTLQVTAVDSNAPARRATAVQSIDFEVAE